VSRLIGIIDVAVCGVFLAYVVSARSNSRNWMQK